jgi:adenylate kinase family enzyme
MSLKDLHFSELLGRKLLIVGDVGSGKTELTARLLKEAITSVGLTNVTAVDMAPERTQFNGIMIGGRLIDFMNGVTGMRVLVPAERVHAPRVEGHTADEVANFSKQNAESIEKLLDQYSAKPTLVLFINDVSMYLQAGRIHTLMKTLALAETLVVNCYEGVALQEDRDSGVSQREREGLATLKGAMDYVLTLDTTVPSASQEEYSQDESIK